MTIFSSGRSLNDWLWSGVSMTTSWAPMPFILSYSPSPTLSSSPSMTRAGYLLGTTRRLQPGALGSWEVLP